MLKKKNVLEVFLGSCSETEQLFSQVKPAFGEEVAFILMPLMWLSFLFRFSQRIKGRLLLLEINNIYIILVISSSVNFI